jgi:hypothetical protein
MRIISSVTCEGNTHLRHSKNSPLSRSMLTRTVVTTSRASAGNACHTWCRSSLWLTPAFRFDPLSKHQPLIHNSYYYPPFHSSISDPSTPFLLSRRLFPSSDNLYFRTVFRWLIVALSCEDSYRSLCPRRLVSARLKIIDSGG